MCPVLQTVVQRHKCSPSQRTQKYKVHVQAVHPAIHPPPATDTHSIDGLAGPDLAKVETALAGCYKVH